MKQNKLFQTGGLLAIIVALGFILVGATLLLSPGPQQPGGGSFRDFMFSIVENATFFRLNRLAFIIVGLAGLGTIPALTRLVEEQNEGMAMWARNLGYLALVVMIIENLRRSFLIPIEAPVYVGGDEMLRQMIGGDNMHITLDPHGWLQFGVLGLSIFIISLLALRNENLSRGWAVLGIVNSIMLALVVVGNVFGVGILVVAMAIMGGIILVPVWFIWIGLLLQREKTELYGLTPTHS